MRGIHSVVDDIRRDVFTEVARLAYEGGDYKQIDALPYKIIPGEVGLSSNMINAFLNNRSLRKASEEVAAEMAAQPCPGEVAKSLITMVQKG